MQFQSQTGNIILDMPFRFVILSAILACSSAAQIAGYGRAPGRPSDLTFQVFDTGTPAFDGKAIRLPQAAR
jgi:hypothetical protein